MRRNIAGAALVVGIALVIGAFALVGDAAPGPQPPSVGPTVPQDTGAGELLVVVLGGVYPSRAEAEAANTAIDFADVQGYYVVPVAQFQGLQEEVGAPGDFALVSAFRTEQGAQEFAAFAQSLGNPATILPNRVRSLGGMYAGMGQEAAPDGSGPLLRPIPESLP